MAKKPNFGSDFGPFGPHSGHQFFFFSKIWLRQSLDIRKKNDPILRKLSDGDGQKNGQTDGREWFHKTLSTNTKLPKAKIVVVLLI